MLLLQELAFVERGMSRKIQPLLPALPVTLPVIPVLMGLLRDAPLAN